MTQSGVPVFQGAQIACAHARLSGLLAHASFDLAAVPTSTGGPIALGFASDADLASGGISVLRERWAAAGLATRDHAPDMHVGAFALPPEVRELIAEGIIPARGDRSREQCARRRR